MEMKQQREYLEMDSKMRVANQQKDKKLWMAGMAHALGWKPEDLYLHEAVFMEGEEVPDLEIKKEPLPWWETCDKEVGPLLTAEDRATYYFKHSKP